MINYFSKEKGKIFSLIFFLFIIISLFSVSAAPPVTTIGSFTSGYELRIPNLETMQQTTPHQFEVHIYNKSDGIPIGNTSVMCFIHLYNSTGNHIYTNWTRDVEHDWDFEFPVTADYFTVLGRYDYIIQCNNSYAGGYAESTFRVIPTLYNENNTTTFLILAFSAVLLLVLAYIFKNHLFAFLAGCAFLITGTYSMIYGFSGITSTYTQMISVIVVGFGLMITLISAYEFLEETSGGDASLKEDDED